jgi:hypothetical protein
LVGLRFTFLLNLNFPIILKKKNYEILSMNNELAELQAKLDRAQNEAHKAENEWNHIQNTAAGKTLLIGKIRM